MELASWGPVLLVACLRVVHFKEAGRVTHALLSAKARALDRSAGHRPVGGKAFCRFRGPDDFFTSIHLNSEFVMDFGVSGGVDRIDDKKASFDRKAYRTRRP